MKSSKCLFSNTIFKSNLKRFLPFCVPFLIAEIIIFPVSIHSTYSVKSPQTLDEFLTLSAVSDGFMFFFAGVMALLVYSYLYSPNKCNALHAFPIGRKALFITSFVSGYVLLVLPQIIGFASGLPAIFTLCKAPVQAILIQTISIFANSFIIYSTAVISVMLAGNIFAGGIIYLIINFLYALLSFIVNAVVTAFGYGVTSMDITLPFGKFLAPIAALISDKLMLDNTQAIAAGYNKNAYYITVAVLLAVSVVLIVLAYLLYRARELECAGDMVAFKVEIPIFSIITSVAGGSAFTLFISAMLSFGKEGYIALYVIFSLIFYFAAQMVLKKSARVFKVKQFVIWFITCAVTLAFVFAAAELETNYIPKAQSVKKVTVNATYDIDLNAPEDVEKVQKLHKLLIDSRKENEKKQEEYLKKLNSATVQEMPDEYYESESISLSYETKHGALINRTYEMFTDMDEVYALLDSFEEAQPPQTLFEKLEGINFKVVGGTYSDDEMFEDEYLNTDELDMVYKFCAEDAKALLKDYRSSKGLPRDDKDEDYLNVTFEIAASSDKDAELISKLSNESNDPTAAFISNNYFGEEETELNSRSFSLSLSSFPKDSKTREYLKNRK